MILTEITDRALWERVQQAQEWSQFQQSWAWGEFRASHGEPVRRFAMVSPDGTWLLYASLVYRRRRFGQGYWYAPRGPIFSRSLPPDQYRDVFRVFCQELVHKALPGAFFWRMEPLVQLGHPEGLMPMRFRRAPPLSPATTLRVDLAQDQDALLKAMHPKTRYNIGLAARKGVTTRVGTHPADLAAFLSLHEETATRDKFATHERAYLQASYDALAREGMARLRLAEHEGRVLAADLEVLYGDTVTYLHGASSSSARELMAPYALHWDAITQAKRDGYRWYDFWGVNPASKATFTYKPSWEGISRFKLGFGGHRVDLYGTWDLPRFTPLFMLAFPDHLWRD